MRTSSISRASAPALRLAIVGAGPSGFYAASRLLNAFPPNDSSQRDSIHIDIFDRLPTPHGLVRYGVAPDHPDVKNVQHKFQDVSRDPRLRFFGNVNVVHSADHKANPYPHAFQLPLANLSPHYTHILFSYGSSQARLLGIPGSHPGQLSGVHSALEFVNWYNGHPAAHDPHILAAQTHSKRSPIDLTANKHHLTVIGAGNVALDVARIVLRSSTPFLDSADSSSPRPTSNHAPGLASLAETDVPEPVLAQLASSKISRVDVFARRGPAQLAFTNKELREIMSIQGIAFDGANAQLVRDAIAEIEQKGKLTQEQIQSGQIQEAQASAALADVRVRKRLLSILQKGSKTKPSADQTKSWGLNFFHSPAAFLPKAAHQAAQPPPVGQVRWNRTSLASGAGATAEATGETVTTDTDMIVSSVGYRSEPLWTPETSSPLDMGLNQLDSQTESTSGPLSTLPFDSRMSIVPNKMGRVVNNDGHTVSNNILVVLLQLADPRPLFFLQIPGVYVSGWLARGPVGVIASTMMDAYTVADMILDDVRSAKPHNQSDPSGDGIEQVLKQSTQRIVSFDDWDKLDEEEKRRGEKLGKLREKILSKSNLG